LSSNPYEFFETRTQAAPTAQVADATRIVLSGTLSVSDVLHAQRLAARLLRWHVLVGLFAAVALLVFLFDLPSDGSPLQLTRAALLVGCVLLPLVLVLNWTRLFWSYSHQARQKIGIFAPSETVVTPEGFSTVTEHAESRVKWSMFRGFRSSDRVVVLYLQFPTQFLLVSRAKLEDPHQWPLLLELVRDALPEL
jgi:hypothetical protein